MRVNESSSSDLREERQKNLDHVGRRNDEDVSREALSPLPEHMADENPVKPFKPRRIDLTPQEPINIGYVGGARARSRHT